MKDQNSRVCLISGGSSGVGLATAKLFDEQGYRISICGRDAERLAAAARDIGNGDSNSVLTVPGNLRQRADINLVFEQTMQRFGRVDVLVNNAACAPLNPLDEMKSEEFEELVDLNIRSVFYLTQAVWSVMKKQCSGIIVNMSSQAAVDPFPGFSAYGSSKAWIESFTTALAGEGKPFGIRTYAIRAGAIETPLLRSLFPDFPAEQCLAPQEVARAIWTCCEPGMRNSNGQVLTVTRQ